MSDAVSKERYCPICEQHCSEKVCPRDGVLTVPKSTLQPHDLELAPGAVVGERYRVEASLGSGGMATVYRATQVSMQRPVALKIMQPGLLVDAQAMKRFYREARAASALRHPNIVNVHDFGVDDFTHIPFIAMELVEGRSLKDILRDEGPLPVRRTFSLLSQVARALVEAHAKGVVHRDLKPDNIMVDALEDGHEHVTVLDFGIAKVADKTGDSQDNLTASGVAIGTPRYMSPEQVLGREVDSRADLYSLGCILHEMLTKAPVYEATEAVQLMMMHVHGEPPKLPESFPEEVRALHGALLAKEQRLRPATTAVVARIAAALASGAPTQVALWLAEAQVVAAEEPTPQLSAPPPVVALSDPGLGVETTMRRDATAPEPRKTPWAWLLGGGAVGIAIVLLVASNLSGADEPEVTPLPAPAAKAPAPAAPPPEPAPAPAPATLQIESVPPGAAVFVDGARVGKTPFELDASDKRRQLELRLRGYRTAKRALEPDASGAVRVELSRRKRPKSNSFPPLAPR